MALLIPTGSSADSCPCCAAAAASGAAPAAAPSGASIYAGRYAWQADDGKAFELGRLAGRPAVVALFYTSCHVACPITVQILSDVDRALAGDRSVAIVLVTIDPETDTAAQLAECRSEHRFSNRVLLLRGSQQATRALAEAAGIVFRREPARLFHVPKIVVLDRSGRVAASFPGLKLDGAEIARAAIRAGS
jgi:protein SCO1/2